MGNNCCHKPSEELALEIEQVYNNRDYIKDKNEYPQDSDPIKQIEENNENINQKEGEIYENGNAYEVEIVENDQKNEIEKDNQVYQEEDNNNQIDIENNVEKQEIEEEQAHNEDLNENEEVNVNIPLSDNNNRFPAEYPNNDNANVRSPHFNLNSFSLGKEQDVLDEKVLGLEDLNNYNQDNPNVDINNYYIQSPVQQTTGDIDFNQYGIVNDTNNQIDYNNLDNQNSNNNYTSNSATNLNEINLVNSEFTFGEEKGSLIGNIIGNVTYDNSGQEYIYNFGY